MPIELKDIRSGYNLAEINNNFKIIERTWDEKLDRLVSLHGNQMSVDLDMNSKAIINVKTSSDKNSLVNKEYVDDANKIQDERLELLEESFDVGSGTSSVSWTYIAVGGETSVNPPFHFNNVRELHVNGLLKTEHLDWSWTESQGQQINLSIPLNASDIVVVRVGGESEDLIPPDVTLEEIYGVPVFELRVGMTISPVNNQYPKLKAFNAIYELAGNSVSYTVKSFVQSMDGDCVITLSDDTLLVAKKVDAASRNWVKTEAKILAKGTTHERTLSERFADSVNVLDEGAVGDLFIARLTTIAQSVGTTERYIFNDNPTDNTAAILRAIDKAQGKTLNFESKGYFCQFADDAFLLRLKSNMTINGNNAVIKCSTNSMPNYDIVSLLDVHDITINDLTVIGDTDTHTGTTGEGGMGFAFRQAKNITLNNCKAFNCWGDGFYTRADTTDTCENIVFNQCVADSNRRQGCSVTGGLGIVFNNCTFKNTGAINSITPCAGLDIEPNANSICDLDVKINNCHFENNLGGSLHVIIGNCLSGLTLEPNVCRLDVNVYSSTSYKDNSYNRLPSRGALRIGGTYATYFGPTKNKVKGGINLTDMNIVDTATEAIWLTNWIKLYPPLCFNNINITDVYSGVPSGDNLGTSSIVYLDTFPEVSADPAFEFGSVEFNTLTYVDTRGNTWNPTATESNHRVKRPVWGRNVPSNLSLENVRFKHFKTQIEPDGLQFMFNSDSGQYCHFDDDALVKSVNTNITNQEFWGLGIIPIVEDSGQTPLVIELPSTKGRQGTYQRIRSHRDIPNRLVFRPCKVSSIAEEDVGFRDGTRISTEQQDAQYEPVIAAGEFNFYCAKEGLWVQV